MFLRGHYGGGRCYIIVISSCYSISRVVLRVLFKLQDLKIGLEEAILLLLTS